MIYALSFSDNTLFFFFLDKDRKAFGRNVEIIIIK